MESYLSNHPSQTFSTLQTTWKTLSLPLHSNFREEHRITVKRPRHPHHFIPFAFTVYSYSSNYQSILINRRGWESLNRAATLQGLTRGSQDVSVSRRTSSLDEPSTSDRFASRAFGFFARRGWKRSRSRTGGGCSRRSRRVTVRCTRQLSRVSGPDS